MNIKKIKNVCEQNLKELKEKEYYIVSNKHTEGYIRTFWRAKNNGYTINLDEAGIYKLDDRYPIITKHNLADKGKYGTYYIAVEDVELLGKRMTCILN